MKIQTAIRQLVLLTLVVTLISSSCQPNYSAKYPEKSVDTTNVKPVQAKFPYKTLFQSTIVYIDSPKDYLHLNNSFEYDERNIQFKLSHRDKEFDADVWINSSGELNVYVKNGRIVSILEYDNATMTAYKWYK